MGNRIEPPADGIEASQKPEPGTSNAGTPVVILRESELTTDLATAIREIRAKEGSACRILVVAPDVPEEPGQDGEDDAGTCGLRFPLSPSQDARRGELEALVRAGERLLPLLGCLDLFLAESETALGELAEAVTDRPRATLQSQVRTLREIVDWTKAVATDLQHETRAVANGFRVVDLGDLLLEASREVEQSCPGIRINLSPNARAMRSLGRAADLGEAMYLGLTLVAERIGRNGGILVEADAGRDVLRIRLRGTGATRRVDQDGLVARFRRLIVEHHGGKIAPDLHGASGAGIVIQLPIVTG